MPASTPAIPAALHFAPRILFLSQSPDAVGAQPARRGADAGGGRAPARRRLDRRDHAGADPGRTTTTRSAAIPYTGFKAGDETPIGADAVRARRLRGHGRRQALRQGLVARAQPGRPRSWPASGWSSPRASSASTARTPTTSACSPRTDFGLVERIAARRGDRRRRTGCGRDALAAAILRSGGLLRFGQRAHARRRAARPHGAGAAPAHAVREDRRAPRAGHRPDTPAQPAPGEGALRARRLALHPRVLHRHVRAHAARDASARPLALHEPRLASSCSRTTPPTSSESPAHVRGGLVPNVRRDVPRRSASSSRDYGLRCHRTLTEARGRARRRQQRRRHLARDDGRALRAARASWSSAPIRTRRTAARSAASPSASAPPTWPTPSSPARCA